MLGGCGLQCLHLVVEHRRRQVVEHGPFVLGPTTGCAAAVDDHHGEALVGEPLRGEVAVVRGQHPLRVRSAVRVEEHRQR